MTIDIKKENKILKKEKVIMKGDSNICDFCEGNNKHYKIEHHIGLGYLCSLCLSKMKFLQVF